MSFNFCSLSSGSSGNCQYLGTSNAKILLDAGLSGKKTQGFLSSIDVDPNGLDGILITHEHKDHIKGAGILSRRFDVPIYANEKTWIEMHKSIGKIENKNVKIINSNTSFEIKGLEVDTFSISHDAVDPIGYSFCYKNKKVSVLTDTGMVDDNMLLKLNNSDLLMIESNHDVNMLKVGSYPQFLKHRVLSNKGHLSNEEAGNLIKQLKLKENAKVLLGHLSSENNFPELAFQTVRGILQEAGMDSLIPEISHRERLTPIFKL